ncbi:HAD-IA family hydrolase [Patescibacteria group bacterium]
MIKAIIFDITGVLFPHQPWIGERPSKDELMKIKHIGIDIYDKNKMSKEYLKKKIFEADRPDEELQQIYNSLAIIDEELLEEVMRLKENYDLYIIANEADKWTDIRKDLSGFEKHFKKVYVSSEIGFKKPNPDVFEYFLEDTGLQPAECLFVDDSERNIEAAQSLGFKIHKYIGFQNFQEVAHSQFM